jgi:hypothetical protein
MCDLFPFLNLAGVEHNYAQMFIAIENLLLLDAPILLPRCPLPLPVNAAAANLNILAISSC